MGYTLFFLLATAAQNYSATGIHFLASVITYQGNPPYLQDLFEAQEYGYNDATGMADWWCSECKRPDKVKAQNKCPYVPAVDSVRPWRKCPGVGLAHPMASELVELIRWIDGASPFALDNQPVIVYNIWNWFSRWQLAKRAALKG